MTTARLLMCTAVLLCVPGAARGTPIADPAPSTKGRDIERTLSVDVGRFEDIQRMSTDELRQHFRLPPSCKPSVSAERVRGSSVDVDIRCAET